MLTCWIVELLGTLTKNEQTVIEIYTVDEMTRVDSGGSSAQPTKVTPALKKALHIGSVCNNARLNEQGVFVGQSTDVALLNVLRIFDMSDPRPVRIALFHSLSST